MQASQPLLIYWDADVILSWLEDHPDRAPLIDLLLADARSGHIEIITSAITQVEVAYAASEARQQALSPEVEQKINALWAPGGPIKIVEFHGLIASRARNIIREGIPKGWSGLRAHDAIHLATAQQMSVGEMHTYEPRLARYSEVLGFYVGEPRTEQPRIV